jgi:hypothetical protein
MLKLKTYLEHSTILVEEISVPGIHVEVGAVILEEDGSVTRNSLGDFDEIRQIFTGYC